MTDETQAAAPASAEDISAALLTDDKPAEQPKAETDQPGDDAAAAQTEGEGEQPKPKKSAQERIDEVTKARRDAERERDFWREQAMRGAPASTPPAAPATAETPTENVRPDPANYEAGDYDPKYIEALTDWKAEQAARRILGQREAAQRTQTTKQRFEDRGQELAKVHDDFHEVVGPDYAKAAALGTPEMNAAIGESDLGPELAYHLAKNPAEARRIAALSPISQVREIGRLEARLSEPPAPKAKTATDAPPATPTVRGAGGQFKVAADTSDFSAFEKAYP